MAQNQLALLCISTLLAASPFFAVADESNTTIRSFSTIGLVNSDSGDNLKFRRNLARTDEDPNEWSFKSDSILGTQITTSFNDNWSASAQFVYKNRIEQSLENSIEWAYIGYQSSPSSSLNYKLGRLGVDVFMLSEYRNVGYAYLWARPPAEFYSPLAFDSIDGADITYTTLIDDSFIQARITAGTTKNNFISDQITIKAFPAIATSFLWEKNNWKVRVGYAYVEPSEAIELYNPVLSVLEASAPIWPEAVDIADDLNIKGKTFNYYNLGLAYDNNDWVIQTEISQIKTKDNVFTSSHSGYLSVGRRFDDVTLFSIASIIENTTKVRQLDALPGFAPSDLVLLRNTLQEEFNSIGVNQKTLGLGFRWDFTHNTALKFQVDRTWIKPHGAGLWGKTLSNTNDETVDTVSINLNFLF